MFVVGVTWLCDWHTDERFKLLRDFHLILMIYTTKLSKIPGQRLIFMQIDNINVDGLFQKSDDVI